MRQALIAAWPYAIEVVAYLAVRFWVLGFITRPNPNNHLTALEIALTIPGAIVSYVVLLAMPWRAAPAHHLEFVASIAAPGFYFPVLGIAVLVGAAFFGLRNNPHRRLILFCALWMAIGLAPMLNLGGLFAQSAIQDRYLYFPSAGLCVAAADLTFFFARRSEAWTKAVALGVSVALLGCMAMLYSVQRLWHDEVAMFTRCAEEAPSVALWHNRLGMALHGAGEMARARREFEIAKSLDPANGWNFYDQGLVSIDLGDFRAAELEMAEGLKRLKLPHPGPYTELAIVADAAGDAAGAEAALAQAEALPQGTDVAILTRAQIRFRRGDRTGAEDAARKLLARDPDNADALILLGAVLSAGRHDEQALAAYRHAERVAPNAPSLHYQIASTLNQMGRKREAREECAVAIEAAPNDPNARALMAAIERGAGAR